MNQLENFKKKQELIKNYYAKISNLKEERKKVNAKLKIVEEKFEELIQSQADKDQLNLFENLDQFLEQK